MNHGKIIFLLSISNSTLDFSGRIQCCDEPPACTLCAPACSQPQLVSVPASLELPLARIQGPPGYPEVQGWRRPIGATSCLQVQMPPLLDSETTPRGIEVLFSRPTHRSPFGNSLVRLTAAVSALKERQAWELVQHLPRAETPCTPHSMSWSRWVTGVPRESSPACAGGAIQIIILHWTLTC